MKALAPLLALFFLSLVGCSTVEYAVKEKFGIHKRDILVSRVSDTREAQDAARQQFKSALDEFIVLTGTGGGALQEKYEKLAAAYERSDSRAQTVRTRISEVERVAGALFAEWRGELSQYSDAGLRSLSERELDETQQRYQLLLEAMRKSAARMQPVLAKFKDQVLFLKHNLNAQVVARLGNTNAQLQSDVAQLISDMEKSIQEADAFIKDMKPSTGN